MKDKGEIYKEYIELGSGPWLFGKEEHWKGYYEGYEMGYQDAADESLNSLIKLVGMDLKNFPLEGGKEFDVMKEALQKYYKEKIAERDARDPSF